jgi:hypothetical protein
MLLLGTGASASGGELERIHGELRRALLDLSEHVEGKWQAELPAPAAAPSSPGCARVLVVAFTGGLVPKVHPRSGVAMLTHRINGMGDDGVAALL